jgi:hypothetical protein
VSAAGHTVTIANGLQNISLRPWTVTGAHLGNGRKRQVLPNGSFVKMGRVYDLDVYSYYRAQGPTTRGPLPVK